MFRQLTAAAAILAAARAQQVCTLTQETHPSMTWQKCTALNSCTNVAGSVTIDANWRWTHQLSGTTNCYDGNTWNKTSCPSNTACAANCCLDGAEYASTYGASTSGNALSLKFVTKGQYSTNIGSRLYLMKDDNNYEIFKLLGNEFTFDVDVSNLPCGLNGALYFVSMDQDGGKAKYPGNKAGAKYGTGYCDSQCPRDVKFINGQANVEGWTPSSNDANAGVGNLGTCCAEMDIWEANSISTAYTPHPCSNNDQHSCTGNACGGTYSTDRYGGTCDPDGCDFNSYRQGDKTFYGPGLKVDTKQKMTVVTQFIKGSNGKLADIKRFYVQGGKVIPNSQSSIAGIAGNSITKAYCDSQKSVFGDIDQFTKMGGLEGMGAALDKGMVLVMSLWDDHYANMLWLDSTYPVGSSKLGAARGTCSTSSGVPAEIEAQIPNSSVIYSNIKFGPINSTFSEGSSSDPGTPTPTNPPTSGTVARYGQCGGRDWKGATACVSPYTCNVVNEWYSQCL